jgi:hypothetical protein
VDVKAILRLLTPSVYFLFSLAALSIKYTGPCTNDFNAHGYDVFGLIGTTFRELDYKTLIFFERAVPISPNASYLPGVRERGGGELDDRVGHLGSGRIVASATRRRRICSRI